MTKNKDMAQQLAALRKQAVADVPPQAPLPSPPPSPASASIELNPSPNQPSQDTTQYSDKAQGVSIEAKQEALPETTAAPSPPTRVIKAVNQSKVLSPPPALLRQRTGVNLTPSATTALRKIQGTLLAEGSIRSLNASAIVSIALELTAKALPDNIDEIIALYRAYESTDGRRSGT